MASITDSLNEKFSVHGSNIADAINQISDTYGNNIAEAISNLVPGSGGGSEGGSNPDDDGPPYAYEPKTVHLEYPPIDIGPDQDEDVSGWTTPTAMVQLENFQAFCDDIINNSVYSKALKSFGFSNANLVKMLANCFWCYDDTGRLSIDDIMLYTNKNELEHNEWITPTGLSNLESFVDVDLGDGSGPQKWIFVWCQFISSSGSPDFPTGGWWRCLNKNSPYKNKVYLTADNVTVETVPRPNAPDVGTYYGFFIPIYLGRSDSLSAIMTNEYEVAYGESYEPVVLELGNSYATGR